MNSNPKSEKLILNELNKLIQLNHPNIVSLFGTIDNPCSIVMEFIKGGKIIFNFYIFFIFFNKSFYLKFILVSLDKWIQDKKYQFISIEEIIEYSIQIASGILYCHSCKIIHGDLKPGN